MTNALDTAFRRLDALDLSAIQSTGDWDLGRTFSHLAQGVEFSMSGYPEQKPKLFQMTAGKLAFTVFKLRGRMSHGLDEPIPGEIIGDVTADAGLHRLWIALEHFRDFDGALRPHFAFGALGKDHFALAHLMHIDNHLEEVRGR
ncbi:DUF1569 domain-containing protein [Gymnodinialimonas ulvae]|uniref:DUF1569 domain-containing protein n=1 Tax=Gymnodinialimonas ulvae TaxID=3126504 RepID=UPI0030A034F6